MFTAFFIAVIGNITYLTTRSPKWDWLGVASVEVGCDDAARLTHNGAVVG